jgi:hypothetical protein
VTAVLSKFCRVCLPNYAAGRRKEVILGLHISLYRCIHRRTRTLLFALSLTAEREVGIIRITQDRMGGSIGEGPTIPKTGTARQGWRPASPPSRRYRSALQGQCLLRPRRPCPGQVRDAAASPSRFHAGLECSDGFWPLATGVLSSTRSVHRKRRARSLAPQTRATRCPQAHRRYTRVLGADTRQRSHIAPDRPRRIGARKIQRTCSPAQYRTEPGSFYGAAGKKTSEVSASPDLVSPSDYVWRCEAAYEALRKEICSGLGAVSSGRQLTIFVHKGMTAWLRIVGELLRGPVANDETASGVTLTARSQLPPMFFSNESMAGLMPPRYYAEAASLLAGMALAARKGCSQ